MSEDIKAMLKGLGAAQLMEMAAQLKAEEEAEKKRQEEEERAKRLAETMNEAESLINDGKLKEALNLFSETKDFSPIVSFGETIWVKMSGGKLLSHVMVTQREGGYLVCTGNNSAFYENALGAFFDAAKDYSGIVSELIAESTEVPAVRTRKPRSKPQQDITPDPVDSTPNEAQETSNEPEIVEEVIGDDQSVSEPEAEPSPMNEPEAPVDENSDDAFSGDEEANDDNIPF